MTGPDDADEPSGAPRSSNLIDTSNATGSSSEDGTESHVVTAFLRNRGEVLLARRSDAVGTYTGQWGAISGFAEGDPDHQVRVEIAEETGLEDHVSPVRSGRELRVSDDESGREWVVHPYLFDCDSREVELSEEHDEFEWVPPTAALDLEFDLLEATAVGRETVPKLWETYERVAPTVRSVAADDEHGAATLSIRTLEALRDRAALLVSERDEHGADPEDEWDELAELARRLLEARPSMAVLRNRVNRAMTDADPVESGAGDVTRGAPALLESALAGIERAVEADRAAAEAAGEHLEGAESVMTHSRSGTVLEAFESGPPDRVFVAESRPAREGVDVAEDLADTRPVTLHTDAAAASVLSTEDIDHVLVGADAILSDGSVINKTGTRSIALAAAREDVPVTVVAATDKVSTRPEVNIESGSRNAVYDGDASIDVLNPTFDVTPADCVTEYVTERGSLEGADIASVAAELRELASWREA